MATSAHVPERSPEGGILASCRGALGLGGALVLAALLLAAVVGGLAGDRGGGAAGANVGGSLVAAGDAPAPVPAAQVQPAADVRFESPAQGQQPQSPPLATPTPPPRLEVATPAPDDPRATVRAVRSGRPRQQRPLSDRGPLPVAAATGGGAKASFSLPMPVPGRWQVTCGYRCGLHDGVHTYGLDLVRLDGPTAGTPVRAPVGGRIVAVTDGTVAYCGGQAVTGAAAGSVVVLEFPLPDGGSGRLRLIHLDPGSIPSQLRPRGTPVPVAAGTYLGSLAHIGPGCAHLHLDLSVVQGGGEVPVPLALAGRSLPDCGREGCWGGTVLP
ncbi:MAG TPA: hypothetical protein VNL95_00465 [Dehalococcoidia bacterium]|nr:hypothetical protein [Dehalococcoidia bacterium]